MGRKSSQEPLPKNTGQISQREAPSCAAPGSSLSLSGPHASLNLQHTPECSHPEHGAPGSSQQPLGGGGRAGGPFPGFQIRHLEFREGKEPVARPGSHHASLRSLPDASETLRALRPSPTGTKGPELLQNGFSIPHQESGLDSSLPIAVDIRLIPSRGGWSAPA